MGGRKPEAKRHFGVPTQYFEEGMMRHKLPHLATSSTAVRRGAGLALAIITCLAGRASADNSNVTEGKRIWAEKGQCVECHGWAGDGARSSLHSPGQAPSLRTTQLDRDQIRMTIQCGRPGTGAAADVTAVRTAGRVARSRPASLPRRNAPPLVALI